MEDIEIARKAKLKNIKEIAKTINLDEDDIEQYGKYKAKISNEVYKRLKDKKDGKLILVTAINPTPLGEGKTTISIGLADRIIIYWKKINSCIKRAFFRTCIWYKRWSHRWRICTSGPNGRY